METHWSDYLPVTDKAIMEVKSRKKEYITNLQAHLEASEKHFVSCPSEHTRELISNLRATIKDSELFFTRWALEKYPTEAVSKAILTYLSKKLS